MYSFSSGSVEFQDLLKKCGNPKLKDYELSTDWNWEKSTVIKLNFALLNEKNIDENVKQQIIASLYPNELYEQRAIRAKPFVHMKASEFLNLVLEDSKFGQRVVLLVDEYDAPLNNNLHNESEFKRLSDSFYNIFFNNVKGAADSDKIAKCVGTGA